MLYRDFLKALREGGPRIEPRKCTLLLRSRNKLFIDSFKGRKTQQDSQWNKVVLNRAFANWQELSC